MVKSKKILKISEIEKSENRKPKVVLKVKHKSEKSEDKTKNKSEDLEDENLFKDNSESEFKDSSLRIFRPLQEVRFGRFESVEDLEDFVKDAPVIEKQDNPYNTNTNYSSVSTSYQEQREDASRLMHISEMKTNRLRMQNFEPVVHTELRGVHREESYVSKNANELVNERQDLFDNKLDLKKYEGKFK